MYVEVNLMNVYFRQIKNKNFKLNENSLIMSGLIKVWDYQQI